MKFQFRDTAVNVVTINNIKGVAPLCLPLLACSKMTILNCEWRQVQITVLSTHGRRKHNGLLLMEVFKWSDEASGSALDDCHNKVDTGYLQISYNLSVPFTPAWCCLSTHITAKTSATSYYIGCSFVHVQGFIPVYPECFLSFPLLHAVSLCTQS